MIFSFLTDLAKNNNKEWFDAHKEAYECAKIEATLLFNNIYTGLAEHDTLAPLKIYRIYRDLRFSKDKTQNRETKNTPFFVSLFLWFWGWFVV